MKYAHFDKVTTKVLRWFDTAAIPYNLPPSDEIIEVSEEQWKVKDEGQWSVEGGTLRSWESSIEMLRTARASKLAKIDEACRLQIVGGFSCNALGEAHFYPADPTDQLNLFASVSSSIIPSLGHDWTTPFWCADQLGVWAYRLHTAAQIQSVGLAGKQAVVNAVGTKIQLEAQIATASLSELQEIVWPAPAI